MTAETEPLRVAPGVVRMRPGQLFPWDHAIIWRRGPDTPDGFWMIYALGGVVGVRVIEDDRAPERTSREFWDALGDAVDPDEADEEATRDAAQDAYLATLTIAAEIPLAELVRLRDAVRAGQAGGPTDGRRTRKGPPS